MTGLIRQRLFRGAAAKRPAAVGTSDSRLPVIVGLSMESDTAAKHSGKVALLSRDPFGIRTSLRSCWVEGGFAIRAALFDPLPNKCLQGPRASEEVEKNSGEAESRVCGCVRQYFWLGEIAVMTSGGLSYLKPSGRLKRHDRQ